MCIHECNSNRLSYLGFPFLFTYIFCHFEVIILIFVAIGVIHVEKCKVENEIDLMNKDDCAAKFGKTNYKRRSHASVFVEERKTKKEAINVKRVVQSMIPGS